MPAAIACNEKSVRRENTVDDAYRISVAGRTVCTYGAGPVAFELNFPHEGAYARFMKGDVYSVAKDFIEGAFSLRGDAVAAVRMKATHPCGRARQVAAIVVAIASAFRPADIWQSQRRARRNIEFHYDRSNRFYQTFLDARMIYSCAYFTTPAHSLEDAQLEKMDLICRKLDIQRDERFLDIGCGWGGLLMHAARRYGAIGRGCTLSPAQAEYATQSAVDGDLAGRVRIEIADFHAVEGQFDKIASVGMFEHVGRRLLHGYFAKVFDLLAPEGLFLNHGIVRPQNTRDGPETRFLRNYVFPGGELAHLADVISIAEKAGFEVLDVENLRPHYALTCRHWVQRLISNEAACIEAVGDRTYRIWLLYLSASALSFEQGGTDVCQVLLAKRSGTTRYLTRNRMMRANGADPRWSHRDSIFEAEVSASMAPTTESGAGHRETDRNDPLTQQVRDNHRSKQTTEQDKHT